jgi:hypothetical protein
MREPMNRKWWLALLALLCLVPGAYAGEADRAPRRGNERNYQQVPEGGSAAVYLLGAGIACLGAMFIRFRASKPGVS